MKRWPPYGTPDGTEWSNGNPATGVRGSVIDARAIDHPQQEIANAITRFGLVLDKDDLEQLGKAIQNYVDAQTGGGATEGYVTKAGARATLPIFPEVTTATGKLTITEPSSGTILVNPVGSILHRGIYSEPVSDIAEVDRTFAMLPSKAAHIRWTPSNGFERFYIDDAGYNPSTLPETDTSFDSTYDDVLLARVVTDESANATITTLINRAQLWLDYESIVTTGSALETGAGSWTLAFRDTSIPIGWARKPNIKALNAVVSASVVASPGILGAANVTVINSLNRYEMNFDAATDYGAPSVSTPRLDIKCAFGA